MLEIALFSQGALWSRGRNKTIDFGRYSFGVMESNNGLTRIMQSVHLSGEQGALVQEEAAAAEKKAWHDKVIVDTLDFKVCLSTNESILPYDECSMPL
jgi:hypothetical protein